MTKPEARKAIKLLEEANYEAPRMVWGSGTWRVMTKDGLNFWMLFVVKERIASEQRDAIIYDEAYPRSFHV